MAVGRKTGGRVKGTPNKATAEKRRARAAAKAEAQAKAFTGLTEDQIQALLPRDVFRLVTHHYVRTGDPEKAVSVAAKWAPYEHPTKTEFSLTPADVRKLADLARAEAARRGLDYETAGGTSAGTVPA